MTIDKDWKIKSWRFVERGGMEIINGKPHWPHHLTVRVGRNEAYRMLYCIIHQLDDQSLDPSATEVDIAWVGELEKVKDD